MAGDSTRGSRGGVWGGGVMNLERGYMGGRKE